MYFKGWQALIDFMFAGLELDTEKPSLSKRRANRR